MSVPPPGLPRRRFLGAAGALAAVAVSACTGGRSRSPDPRRTIGASPPGSTSTTSTTAIALPPDEAVDLLILRTGSSIEHYAAGVYTQLEGSGLVASEGVRNAIRFFADHHSAHSSIFEGATGRAGGTPFTQANPVLSQGVEARLRAMRTERDVVALAYGVEAVAAATYAANAAQMTDPGLVPLVAGIGAAEARHLAVLGTFLSGLTPAPDAASPPYPPDGLLGGTGAVAPGVGLS